MVLELPDPPLADTRVALRSWTDADLSDAVAGSNDPLVPRFTSVPENNTLENVLAYVATHEPKRRSGEELHLAMADPETDRFLGPLSLFRFDWAAREGEIGYWLAPWARGRGVATSAVTLLSGWAFDHLPLTSLKLRIDEDNDASLAVAARAGFTQSSAAAEGGIVTLHRTR